MSAQDYNLRDHPKLKTCFSLQAPMLLTHTPLLESVSIEDPQTLKVWKFETSIQLAQLLLQSAMCLLEQAMVKSENMDHFWNICMHTETNTKIKREFHLSFTWNSLLTNNQNTVEKRTAEKKLSEQNRKKRNPSCGWTKLSGKIENFPKYGWKQLSGKTVCKQKLII